MHHLIRLGALVVAGSAVALVLVEVSLRISWSPEQLTAERGPLEFSEAARWVDHPFLPHAGRPNASYTIHGTEEGASIVGTVTNNRLGYRSEDFTQLPEDAFVVVALGGSTTWGAHAESNQDTWPGILERLLAEEYPAQVTKVFNL